MSLRPPLTPQQAAAIQTRGVSIALSAGAGCGKTFVLTQRFLAGLEPNAAGEPETDLHQLVAMTFTERAAREMRNRIRAACHERLQNCQPNEVDHWLGILRGLDAARISTIHSFCTSLLRSQAVEAGLDPRFTVLESALADTLLRHVARDTLHDLIEREDDDAVQFVVRFGLERARELLRKLSKQRFQIEFATFAEVSPEQLTASWLQRWQTEFVPKLVAKFREAPLVERVLNAIADSPSKNAAMIERIANLGSLLPPRTPWPDVSQTLAEVHENARVQGGGGKKDWVSEERQVEIKLAFEKLRKGVTALQECLAFRMEDVTKSAELACRAFRLTERTANRYATAKRAQGALDFDDLLLLARNLLRDHEHVRQRVSAGIRLLMVDEFQDTDPVQADVVRSLCGAALTRGKLFMVGDRKQSIYRFRRADPTVFATMSDEIPSSGRLPLNVNFRSQPAVLNFVNHLFAPAMNGYEPLVPFLSEQFSPTPAVEFLFAAFDADGTDAESRDMEAIENEDLTLPTVSSSPSDDDERPNAAALRAREADWIARRIATLLTDATPRIRTKGKDTNGSPLLRRVGPGDIVILFRALSSVQEYESALLRYGLGYYLVGGKAFFAQQEVFDLLNLCRYLDDCDDLVGLVGILRSPFFNLSDDAIQAVAFHTEAAEKDAVEQRSLNPELQLSSHATASLHQTLYLDPPTYLPEDQRSRIRFAAEILADLRIRKDRIPLSDLLTEAVERTGYDAAILTEFLGSRKLANLRKLIEMARQFDRDDFFTLKDFVTRLQTSVLEETDEEFATTLPESDDVIRLMSIHQSKGLEFPVVIVADIDRKGPPRGSDAVLHPELGPLIKSPEQFGDRTENIALKMHKLAEEEADADETIRLFYVACTRAADYLILSTGRDHDKPTQSPWLELVESRFDIRTGLLKIDPLLGSSESGTAGRDHIPDILVHHVPCDAKRSESQHERRISLGKIPGQVLAAEPCDFPASARIFPRDTNDLSVVSVSRIEAIDAELRTDASITVVADAASVGLDAGSIRHGQTLIDALILTKPQHVYGAEPRLGGSGKRIDTELREATHSHGPKRPIANDASAIDLGPASSLGTLVHAVLERANFRDPIKWPDLLLTAVNQSQDALSDDIVQQARTMLSRFFASPIAAELAQVKSIHREIDFLLPWPSGESPKRDELATPLHSEPLISGIIDLLIETDAGWHVLDYKTGDFPLQTPVEELLAPYQIQLGLYAYAIEQWFGATPQELSLIAFRPQIRRITLKWSSVLWDQIRTRVDRAIESLRLDQASPTYGHRRTSTQ